MEKISGEGAQNRKKKNSLTQYTNELNVSNYQTKKIKLNLKKIKIKSN